MPFQRDEMVCPLAKVQVSVQLVQAVELVLLMVRAAPKALEFCGEIVYVTLHTLLEEEELTVNEMVVDAVSEPEVPVMVTVDVPAVAELLAVKVTVLELVELAGLNEAVTPLGNPEAANVTLPLNGLISVTVMVSVAVLPWVSDRVEAEGASVKPPDELTTASVNVVVVVMLPEVPVMVIVLVPTVAESLAVRVSELELVEDVGLNEAVTPLGNPETAKVTLSVKPSTSVTVMVSVAVLPWMTERVEAEGANVKVGVVLIGVWARTG
jgi:hypothetical protein